MTTRFWLRLLAVVVLVPAMATFAQQPPDGGGGGKGKGGRGGGKGGRGGQGGFGGQFNPGQGGGELTPGQGGGGRFTLNMTGGGGGDAFFDSMSQGRDFIDRSQVDAGRQRFLDTMGLTGERITRAQFTTAMDKMRASREAGGGGGGPKMVFSSTVDASGAPQLGADQISSIAERGFNRADKNGDGLLQVDEMPDRLKAEWQKWDSNGDGALDINEYKAYLSASISQRIAERMDEQGADAAIGLPPTTIDRTIPEEERRPIVYRSGKLPRELPDWFERLDTDHDGQVGLYEWVSESRSPEEFRSMDRNDDGFLTVEEVLAYQRNGNKQIGLPGSTAVASASSDFTGGGSRGGMGGPGRNFDPQNGGFGPGSRGGRGGRGPGGPGVDSQIGGSGGFGPQNGGGPGRGGRGSRGPGGGDQQNGAGFGGPGQQGSGGPAGFGPGGGGRGARGGRGGQQQDDQGGGGPGAGGRRGNRGGDE